MTYIKKNKVLVFIIAVLLLSNFTMLYVYINRCKGTSKKEVKKQTAREYMVDKLKTEVGFSEAQIAKYEDMSNKHKQTMKPLFGDIKLAKDSLYKLLQQKEPADSLINHYLVNIGEKQQAIDHRVFNHFFALKQICTPQQQPKYDSLIQKVVKGMISPKGHK